VVLDVFKLDPALWWTPLGMLAVGVVAGVIPAVKAYRTDVATHLVPAS
jgi:putative ABC transport system permease protein